MGRPRPVVRLPHMTRLLIRTYRDPFAVASPEDVLEQDLFGGDNNGNLLFSEAAVRALAVTGVEVTCLPLESQPLRPEEVNERFDHVVLPFANAFRGSFKGRLRAYTRFIEQLAVPVTVLGVGAQSDLEFGFESLQAIDDPVRRFLRAVLDRGPSIGVRGEFTASYVRHLGFDDVEVIGCPSMFMLGPDLKSRQPETPLDATSLVGFNLTPKLDRAERLARDLVERYPRLTYFPQGKRELELVLWGSDGVSRARNSTDAGFNDLVHPLFTQATTHVHVHPLAWIEDLARFDFNLGTRIHGNIAAILGGTPSHLLSADSRTRELAEYFELPWTPLVDVSSPLDLNDLAAGADYTAVGRGHQGRFERYTAFLESHGLRHLWQDGMRSAYDKRLKGKALPAPAVSGPDTPIDLVTRMGWLKRRQDVEIARLEERVVRQEAELATLHRRLDRRVTALEKRRRPTLSLPRVRGR